MKAMVVGAAGFVGPYLIDAIEDQLKCEIVATKLEHEKVNIPKARIEDLDITNPLAIVSLLQRRAAGLYLSPGCAKLCGIFLEEPRTDSGHQYQGNFESS